MRRCRECSTEMPPAAKCTTVFGKKRLCSPECASEYAVRAHRIALERETRKSRASDREKIKTRSDHAREAQSLFNAFIRERDKDLPCISCGRHHKGQYHAGHYRTVGSNPQLRFCEINVHKQCAPCNSYKSGNIVEYRINLIRKIGAEALAWLEGYHEPKRYTIDDLKEIKADYRKKLKILKNRLQ